MSKISIRYLRVGVDPGSLYTRVCVEGREIKISEPSVAAADYATGEIVAVGTEAAILLRSKAGQLEEIRPFVGGEVRHYDAARWLLQSLLEKVQRQSVTRPEVCLAVPRSLTSVQKRVWTDVASHAGARSTVLVDRAAAAALGCGIDLEKPQAVLAADIGLGMTASVMAGGGYLVSAYDMQGGGGVAEAIRRFLSDTYGVFADAHAVRTLQREVAVAVASVDNRSVTMEGRLREDGTERIYTVHSTELYPVILPAVQHIATVLQRVLRACPPQAHADIVERGIVLTGGGALLAGLDLYLPSQLGVATVGMQEPFGRVAEGAVIALAKRKVWPYLLEGAEDPYGRNG